MDDNVYIMKIWKGGERGRSWSAKILPREWKVVKVTVMEQGEDHMVIKVEPLLKEEGGG